MKNKNSVLQLTLFLVLEIIQKWWSTTGLTASDFSFELSSNKLQCQNGYDLW